MSVPRDDDMNLPVRRTILTLECARLVAEAEGTPWAYAKKYSADDYAAFIIDYLSPRTPPTSAKAMQSDIGQRLKRAAGPVGSPEAIVVIHRLNSKGFNTALLALRKSGKISARIEGGHKTVAWGNKLPTRNLVYSLGQGVQGR